MLDDDFKNIKRSAVVLVPRQPFFDWLLTHDADTIIDDEIRTGNIYLLPDYETKQEIEQWLKRNFAELFEEELFGWYTDETMWPTNRSFKLFGEWFSYSLFPMLLDTQRGMIEKL